MAGREHVKPHGSPRRPPDLGASEEPWTYRFLQRWCASIRHHPGRGGRQPPRRASLGVVLQGVHGNVQNVLKIGLGGFDTEADTRLSIDAIGYSDMIVLSLRVSGLYSLSPVVHSIKLNRILSATGSVPRFFTTRNAERTYRPWPWETTPMSMPYQAGDGPR